MNENLTQAVIETLENDNRTQAECRRIARRVTAAAPTIPADNVGRGICISIGERLSLRFDGAVPPDGIHECLWLTFMSQVDWEEVGRYYLEETEQEKKEMES